MAANSLATIELVYFFQKRTLAVLERTRGRGAERGEERSLEVCIVGERDVGE